MPRRCAASRSRSGAASRSSSAASSPGLGGALIGPVTAADPNLGYTFGLKGFVAVAIGGFGSATGALAGGFVLGISEAMMVTYSNDAYRTFAGLGLMLIILLVRPQGLMGRVSLRQV